MDYFGNWREGGREGRQAVKLTRDSSKPDISEIFTEFDGIGLETHVFVILSLDLIWIICYNS